ncbi:MAG: peptide deformylase, partial [Candidatus Cryptobacteroides sp.]
MRQPSPDKLSVLLALAVTAAVVLCIYFTSRRADDFPGLTLTDEELALIGTDDSLMRVLTVADTSDVRILRALSDDFSAADLLTDAYARLCTLMVSTVTSPEQDGVGIAGPQVGLDRRVVAVQRFDKDGFPFEVYANIRIEEFHGDMVEGPEGCLS